MVSRFPGRPTAVRQWFQLEWCVERMVFSKDSLLAKSRVKNLPNPGAKSFDRIYHFFTSDEGPTHHIPASDFPLVKFSQIRTRYTFDK